MLWVFTTIATAAGFVAADALDGRSRGRTPVEHAAVGSGVVAAGALLSAIVLLLAR